MQSLEERVKASVEDCVEEWGEWEALGLLLEECEYVLRKIIAEYKRNKYTLRCANFSAEIVNFRHDVFDE
jgi:hypothetical protein